MNTIWTCAGTHDQKCAQERKSLSLNDAETEAITGLRSCRGGFRIPVVRPRGDCERASLVPVLRDRSPIMPHQVCADSFGTRRGKMAYGRALHGARIE
jgi:hypothetical protein